MYARFPIFNTACDLAQNFWSSHILDGDAIIDATIGNGHDTLFLAKALLKESKGTLFGFDIQEKALVNTQKLLSGVFTEEQLKRVVLFHENHDQMKRLVNEPIKLIVYNLGYLPGSDKKLTTLSSSTLDSIKQGMDLLVRGGLLSIVCYPGHAEGEEEETILLEFFKALPGSLWSSTHFQFLNRNRAPSLILVQKSL